jgi:hypothetical protein
MYIEVTQNIFSDYFNKIWPDNFTYDGQVALFNYLEQFEDDCDERAELDVIALCCEYSETTHDEHYNNYDDRELAEELICTTFEDKYGEQFVIVREG